MTGAFESVRFPWIEYSTILPSVALINFPPFCVMIEGSTFLRLDIAMFFVRLFSCLLVDLMMLFVVGVLLNLWACPTEQFVALCVLEARTALLPKLEEHSGLIADTPHDSGLSVNARRAEFTAMHFSNRTTRCGLFTGVKAKYVFKTVVFLMGIEKIEMRTTKSLLIISTRCETWRDFV